MENRLAENDDIVMIIISEEIADKHSITRIKRVKASGAFF